MAIAAPRFEPGTTAVRRDVLNGRVWSAQPYRTLSDDGSTIELAYWPGVESLAPITWSTALRTGDEETRKQGLHDLAAGQWELAPWPWRGTVLRSHFTGGEYFSVHYFQDPDTGTPLRLYVNFEMPYTRTSLGIDTFDLFVDLVVEPDLSKYYWKDTDEYAQGRRLGLVDDSQHKQVEAARERVLVLLQEQTAPFTGVWPRWSPDPAWPNPQLPAGADQLSR
ncbi:DUF402 domain-containing protein [Kitasatospora sp. NPDC059088]|uniref:DUF402 domain-containing protein n=1 Tax=Kitasatospora sp. NPDC059088 TaxID=3346722 RepID=UPI003686653B